MLRAMMMVAIALWSANTAQAARVVQFEILVDGQIVLTVFTHDQGGADADKVWGYLKSEPARNPADVYVVTGADAERLKTFHAELSKITENKTTLKGKCRVFCRYGGDVTVDELKLVRASNKAPWFIDPAQVDELAKKRTVDPAKRTRGQVDAAPGK
jgi:hypothetical protein